MPDPIIGISIGENIHQGAYLKSCRLHPTGTAEWEAAIAMVERLPATKRISLEADKHYDTTEFIAALREIKVTPHVAQNTTTRRSAIDERTTSHPNYRISQKARKRITEIPGWMKTVGIFRKTRYIGTEKVAWHIVFTAAYNLVRMRNLLSTA